MSPVALRGWLLKLGRTEGTLGTMPCRSGVIARLEPVVRPKLMRLKTRPDWVGLQTRVSVVMRFTPAAGDATVSGATTR